MEERGSALKCYARCARHVRPPLPILDPSNAPTQLELAIVFGPLSSIGAEVSTGVSLEGLMHVDTSLSGFFPSNFSWELTSKNSTLDNVVPHTHTSGEADGGVPWEGFFVKN